MLLHNYPLTFLLLIFTEERLSRASRYTTEQSTYHVKFTRFFNSGLPHGFDFPGNARRTALKARQINGNPVALFERIGKILISFSANRLTVSGFSGRFFSGQPRCQ
jgi:hypothetical protein